MLGNLFHLTNLHLEYFDGYIYAGVTPMYVQPPPRPQHTVHDHPSAPKTHDHPLPMNGAFEDENWVSSPYYSHNDRYHEGYHDDRRHYYDDLEEEDLLHNHDYYDYGRRYHDDYDRGVEYNGHDFFYI